MTFKLLNTQSKKRHWWYLRMPRTCSFMCKNIKVFLYDICHRSPTELYSRHQGQIPLANSHLWPLIPKVISGCPRVFQEHKKSDAAKKGWKQSKDRVKWELLVILKTICFFFFLVIQLWKFIFNEILKDMSFCKMLGITWC